MNKSKDLKLVRLYKKGDSIAAKEIIDKYQNLVANVIIKFSRRNPHINVADLMDDINIIINNSVSTFNPKKNASLCTWIYNNARFHCLNTNKNKSRIINSEDVNIPEQSYESHSSSKENGEYIFNILSQIKDDRIKRIFEKRYINFDSSKKINPWKNVAEEMGISITMAINLHEKGKKILLEKLNDLRKPDII